MRNLFLSFAGLTALIGGSVLAEAPKTSLRPVARVALSDVTLTSASFLEASKRPVLRPDVKRISVGDTKQISEVRFQGWIKRFKNRAKRNGITQATLDRAFRGVRYNAYVIDKDRNQNEFTKTVWEYLESAASETRIKNGKAALREHSRKLDAIEKTSA